jgi:hypothetical protein
MSDLIIREPLASRIREIAQRENRAPEAVTAGRFLEPNWDEIDNPPPRPHESLTDDDIEVPEYVHDAEAYREVVRALRPKLYRLSRLRRGKRGNYERLALTDEQVDKFFGLLTTWVPNTAIILNFYHKGL